MATIQAAQRAFDALTPEDYGYRESNEEMIETLCERIGQISVDALLDLPSPYTDKIGDLICEMCAVAADSIGDRRISQHDRWKHRVIAAAGFGLMLPE